MTRALTFGLVLLLGVAASGCRDSGSGDAFALDGKIFVFNYRVATATYLVNIKALRPSAEGQKAVVSFENPAGGPPIIITEKIWPQTAKTTIHSPPVYCIVKDRPYHVSIRVEDAKGAVIQQIETDVVSGQDQTDLPDRPLVVGPFYTPNPELAGHPGGDLPGNGGVTCPATE